MFRTKPSVLKELRGRAEQMAPRNVVRSVTRDAGGPFGASTSSDLPRGFQQAKDQARKLANAYRGDPRGVTQTDSEEVRRLLGGGFLLDYSSSVRYDNDGRPFLAVRSTMGPFELGHF